MEDTGEFARAPEPVSPAIAVLTDDVSLYDALQRALSENHDVRMAVDLRQASELAVAGRCAILITDQATTPQASALITDSLRRHDPALISIAVGNRGDDGALMKLMSSGAVDRFMLKPITPALARIVIESASKEYQARRPRCRERRTDTPVPEFTMRRARPAADPRDRFVDTNDITQPVEVVRESRDRETTATQYSAVEESPKDSSTDAHAVPAPHDRMLQSDASSRTDEMQNAHDPTLVPRLDMAALPREDTSSSSPFGRTTLPRPSWIALVAAAIAVGIAVWWVMLQRLPDIDPRQLIETNLAAAAAAVREDNYIEPADRSAFHYYTSVLALDPANAQARAGLDAIAEHFVERTEALIAEGRFAEAVDALQNVRRVRPRHAQVASLENELRDRLQKQFAQAEKSPIERAAHASSTASKSDTAAPSSSAARAGEPRQRNIPVVSDARFEKAPDAPAVQVARATENTETSVLPEATHQPAYYAGMTVASDERGTDETDAFAFDQTLAAAVSTTPVTEVASPAALTTEPQHASVPSPEPVTLVLVRQVQPSYPKEARLRGIEGWVDVSFQVSAAGDVIEPRVEDSSMKHLFSRPALAAVGKWKYRPLPAGSPASERIRTRVVFELRD